MCFLALRQNYVVDRFYRAWFNIFRLLSAIFFKFRHFEKFSDHLFKDYVRLFLRLKVEASGFPAGIESDEQKQEFVRKYKEKYEVDIRVDKARAN